MESAGEGDATILGVERGEPAPGEAFRPVTLRTARGPLALRLYPAEGARSAAVYVGGVGGGWDTPARGLYPRLCEELAEEGIAGLRVRFREPTVLDEAVADVLAAARWLRDDVGISALALVGHSFGGAVAVRAAAALEQARTVVALATQAHGADAVGSLAPRCSILLLHGTSDAVLSAANSQHLHGRAGHPKELILYPAAGHALDEVAGDVHADVRAWLLASLRPAAGAG